MKHILSLFLLYFWMSALRGETFEQITSAFPLGTDKETILKKEPTATVGPCLIPPLDSSAIRESIVVMKPTEHGRLVVQFYLVSGRLGAMMLASASMPGTPANKQKQTNFLAPKTRISSFSALRVDGELNPLEIEVQMLKLDQSNQVALIAASPRGDELWIVDERVFNAKSFFMEPTRENRDRILKSKAAIEEQRKSFEATK
jgi:hypothetical protein